MKLNTIHLGNCIEIISQEMEANSIDLIFADPPYNLSGKSLDLVNNQTGGAFYKVNEDWDTWTPENYLLFTQQWITQAWHVLKPSGSLYISCTFHSIAEIITTAKNIGFKLNNILTWYKTNAMPSITKRTFTHATEYVCWFVKGKKWKFNYQAVKQFNPSLTKDNQLKQMRDFLNFIELPIVQGAERLHGKNGRALHPTQKPEKLLELILIASSNEGDIVLDPFFGTGTTGVVAQKLKRHWIGIESNTGYYDMAIKRLFELEKERIGD